MCIWRKIGHRGRRRRDSDRTSIIMGEIQEEKVMTVEEFYNLTGGDYKEIMGRLKNRGANCQVCGDVFARWKL